MLTRVINELRGVSLEEFKNKVGGSDFLDLKNSEYGTDQTKTIHLDVINAVKSGKTDFADHYDLNTLKEIRSLVSDTVTVAERREFFRVADIDNGKEKNSMTNIERIIHEAEEEKKEAIKQVEEEKKEAIKQAEEEKKQAEEERKQFILQADRSGNAAFY